jgi:hypothetical protein
VFLCARRFATTLAARIAAADALLEAWLFRSSLRLLAVAVCASSSLFHLPWPCSAHNPSIPSALVYNTVRKGCRTMTAVWQITFQGVEICEFSLD